MKIVEFINGLRMPITNEESDVLSRFDNAEHTINKQDLTEREQVLANQLVNKGVLVRKNTDGQIHYCKQVNH
jgi:hypothetical protein